MKLIDELVDTMQTQTVICPWCNKYIEIIPSANDIIVCTNCNKKSELWADGDIGFNSWYLTKITDA